MLNAAKHEERTSSMQGTLFQYIGLAIILLIAEELGRLLGLSGLGLKISPMWPATGIALAALLLLGWRIWPGIFLGFLIYNCFHLALSYSYIGLLLGIGASIASLAQALLGAILIQRFSSISFYYSLHNTLLFLAIAILTCLIAPTLNIALLYMFDDLPKHILFLWINFWMGDTIGVLLFSPLIISFALSTFNIYTEKNVIEASALFILLSLASLGIFFGTPYPIHIWVLPFLLWAIFRFNIQGLTASLALISFIALLASALGYGPYENFEINYSLFFLVNFIGVITATMYILTSILNENNEATKILKEHTFHLENTVSARTHQLEEAKDEIIVREKLTSLAVLAAGISHEIKNPLSSIHELTDIAQDCTKNIKEAFETNNTIPTDISDFVQTNYNTLKGCLVKIEDYNKQAQEVVNIVLHRSKGEAEYEKSFKLVNIHNILNGCCNKAIREFELKTPYALNVIKNYDTSIGPIEIITMDLSRALTNIIDNAVYALKQKTTHHVDFFEPTLSIQTINHEHDIEINIEDNGLGMTDAIIKRLFKPFFSTKPLGEGTGLGIALAHDIIVQGHQGTITVFAEKEKFTKFVITLPKFHLTSSSGNE